jgi:hypothetical protein
MNTLENNLKKKLKQVKKTAKIPELVKIEETKNPTDKKIAMFGYTKEKRLENIERRGEIVKAVEKVVTNFSKSELTELSKASGLSIKAVKSIVSNKKSFKQWKARQSRGIDLVGLSALAKLIRTVSEGRVSPYQAGLLFQMLRGQIIREPKNTNPTTSISIGDNRRVNVYYPNFTQKDKQTEFNTAPKTPETL